MTMALHDIGMFFVEEPFTGFRADGLLVTTVIILNAIAQRGLPWRGPASVAVTGAAV